MARYLLLHGFGGIGYDHWLVWLSGELRSRGHVARMRKLPSPNAPVLQTWLEVMTDRLAHLTGEGEVNESGDPSGDLVVVAHSLGARLWLHHAQIAAAREPSDDDPMVDRVVLVAPPRLPDPAGDAAAPGHLNGFEGLELSAIDPARVARHTRVVVSGNDRYWPEGGAAAGIAEPLGLPVDHLGDCGHFEPQDGFGPWPGMLAWCLGEADVVTR